MLGLHCCIAFHQMQAWAAPHRGAALHHGVGGSCSPSWGVREAAPHRGVLGGLLSISGLWGAAPHCWGLLSIAGAGSCSPSPRCCIDARASPVAEPRLSGMGSVAVMRGLCCPAACGVFLDQGSNPYPLRWQAGSQPLDHQGCPHDHF